MQSRALLVDPTKCNSKVGLSIDTRRLEEMQVPSGLSINISTCYYPFQLRSKPMSISSDRDYYLSRDQRRF